MSTTAGFDRTIAQVRALERDLAAARREHSRDQNELAALLGKQSVQNAARAGLTENPMLEKELKTLEAKVAEPASNPKGKTSA